MAAPPPTRGAPAAQAEKRPISQTQRCGLRRDQGGQFVQDPPAHFLGSNRRASALTIIKSQPLAFQLFARHAVLFLKIVDDVLLLLAEPSREGNQQ